MGGARRRVGEGRVNDERDIYRRQGFAHTLGIGAAPALLIIDFVVGFTDPAHFGGPDIVAAIDRTVGLLAHARAQRWPVAHTRVVYADDGSDGGVFAAKVPSLLALTEASPLSQIVPELTPVAGELVIRKRQASAFFATGLADWLALRRVDTAFMAGCTTSGCVRASVIDGCSHNFRPIVVTDCVGDRARGPHEANLFDMGQKYADLMSLDEVLHSNAARAVA
jgi:maleamate amidohydrolase